MSLLSQIAKMRIRVAITFLVLLALFGERQHAHASDQVLMDRKVQKIMSDRGVQAWLVEDHQVPLVAMKFAFTGGTSQDPAGSYGATRALAELLLEGTAELDAKQFNDKLSNLAVELAFNASTDALTGSLVSLTKRLDAAAELLRQVLEHPRFEQQTFERTKRTLANRTEFGASNPQTIAHESFYALTFPGHVFGRIDRDERETVKRLVVEDIIAQYKKQFARSNVRVVFVGDIDGARARVLLDSIFGALPQKGNIVPVPPASRTIIRQKLRHEGNNASAVFSMSAPRLKAPDFFAMLVLNQIVGSGGFEARLTQEVRVRRGLTYGIDTRIIADRMNSFMLGNVSTKAENIGTALDAALDVLTGISTHGPTESELTGAKNSLISSYLLNLDTSASLAANLLGLWLDGLGPEYHDQRSSGIAKVTSADVRSVAVRYFTRANWSYVAVGGDVGSP